ncbi:MAG: IclR family transcriptional regulator [Bacilli bacterium]|nr:IclR family transcriptional regulator [Bacilli bacterium]
MASNKTVEKTLKILQLISKYSEGITLSEIHKKLNLPKATVFDILQALYKEDAIYYKDQHLKTYVIGSKIFAIGQAYTKNSNFINFASQGLKDFANRRSLTVFACKRLGDKLIYIYKFESPKTRITTTDIGVQMPLHINAAGKAFLAFATGSKKEELLEKVLSAEFDGIAGERYKELLEELTVYEKLGYVLDNGVTENYICTYAVPVYNFEDKIVGVLSAARIANNETEEEISKEIEELQEIARYVSLKQGYREPKVK